MVHKKLLLNKPRAKGGSLLEEENKAEVLLLSYLHLIQSEMTGAVSGVDGTCQNACLCWRPVTENEDFSNQTNQLHVAAGLPRNTMQSWHMAHYNIP